MDLAEYEWAKFELAAILRDAAVILRHERPDVQDPLGDLFARLAEDRFNVAVVGRFSRGKSSLMNAMLDTDRLPTGILPLTSVVTTVSYGSKECAFIEHEGWSRSLARQISLDELPTYITQQRNPGNARRVALARIELPAELLRRGFYFVDTPGLGSSITANTRTTERFLPEADALMLVTSYDSPLSEEELRLLEGAASSRSRIFLVVNKQDTVSPEERNQVLAHVQDLALEVFGDPLPEIFSVSAREAMEANTQSDGNRYIASGVAHLREELARFLLNERQTEFLLRMCARIAEALRDMPNAQEVSERLRVTLGRITECKPNGRPVFTVAERNAAAGNPRFVGCSICERIDHGMYDFLCRYQYDVTTRREVQTQFVEHRGLCAFHTWQYEAMASPQGTCVGFSPLLERLAGDLRQIVATAPPFAYATEMKKLRPSAETCDLCRARLDIERAAVANIAHFVEAAAPRSGDDFFGLCLDHLRLVVEAIEPGETTKRLLSREADAIQRLAEDMHRYALKHDGVRRFLASAEELSADKRALMLVAGHRSVNGLRKLL